MEFRPFDPIRQLLPGDVFDVKVHIDFNGKPEAVKFKIGYCISCKGLLFCVVLLIFHFRMLSVFLYLAHILSRLEQYSYPVVLIPSIGDLLRPCTLSESEYVKLQSMNHLGFSTN